MALVIADRVRDTSTTTGTGTLTLANSPPTGYQSFGTGVGNANTTYYTIVMGSSWEVGLGTYTSSGTTLSRTTVLASSNSGSLVNFGAGTKDVFGDYPAGKAVYLQSDSSVVLPGLVNISGASAGQIQFPSTQNPSADVNTLDDYEEGTWTPVLTFVTPGNLSVAYSVQVGSYTKIGRMVSVTFCITTSSFTHTSASGNLRITGLPFACRTATGLNFEGAIAWSGATKAGYTDYAAQISSGASEINIVTSGSGSVLQAADTTYFPTGGTVILRATISYET